MGYDAVALNYIIKDKLPADIVDPIPQTLPFPTPSSLKILHRCTMHLTDPSQNARLSTLGSVFDILALRPDTEKSLSQACQSLECDLISLDMTIRYPFYFRQKTLSQALQRGVKFEICYASGVLASDAQAKKNLISNATQLIRATRGKGLVLSSEAKKALSIRAPWDVVNLASLWGLGPERGVEAVSQEARSAMVQSRLKRTGYRGVIDVVYGGEKSVAVTRPVEDGGKQQIAKGKRKAVVLKDDRDEKPISKREQKRRRKAARLEAVHANDAHEGEDVTKTTLDDISERIILESKASGEATSHS